MYNINQAHFTHKGGEKMRRGFVLSQIIFSKAGGGFQYLLAGIHLVILTVCMTLVTHLLGQVFSWPGIACGFLVFISYLYVFYFSEDQEGNSGFWRNITYTIAFVPVVLAVLIGVLLKSVCAIKKV